MTVVNESLNISQTVWTPPPRSTLDHINFVVCWAMVVFSGWGILFNIISIYIYTRQSMRSVINILLTGLSFADLSLVILAIPCFAFYGLNSYYQNPTVNTLMVYVSVTLYPLAMIAQTASIWTMVLLTVERYIAVCHPLRSLHLCTITRSKLALMLVCVFAFLYNLIRFWEYRIDNFGMSQYHLRADHTYYLAYYTSLYLLTQFLIPFSILLVLNSLVVRGIVRARRARAALSRRERTEHSTAIMLIVVIVVFAVCNVLLIVLNLVECVYPDFFRNASTTQLAYVLNDVGNLLVVINSSTTWIIYHAFCRKYRTMFNWMLMRVVCVTRLTYVDYAFKIRRGDTTFAPERSSCTKYKMTSYKPTQLKQLSYRNDDVSLRNGRAHSTNSTTTHANDQLRTSISRSPSDTTTPVLSVLLKQEHAASYQSDLFSDD